MWAGQQNAAGTGDTRQELVIKGVFDAPRELVFKAWTDSTQVAAWWGPDGFTNPICELDPHPGGAIHIEMRGPDGSLYAISGAFHEVAEPERLVLKTGAIRGEDGRARLEVLHIATFNELGGSTELQLRALVKTVTAEGYAASQGLREGWTESFDRLSAHLGLIARPEDRK
jgi:uncharacterized protein YndB with AHSA1/START domain